MWPFDGSNAFAGGGVQIPGLGGNIGIPGWSDIQSPWNFLGGAAGMPATGSWYGENIGNSPQKPIEKYFQSLADAQARKNEILNELRSVKRPGELALGSLLDPKTGLIAEPYQTKIPSETSPWGKLMLERQGMEQQGLLEQASRDQGSQLASAQSALMRKGGLSSGASERLARSSAQDAINAQQNIRGQGAMSRLGIRADDISKAMGIQDATINRSIREAERNQQMATNLYNKQMDAYGGARTGMAILGSGKA